MSTTMTKEDEIAIRSGVRMVLERRQRGFESFCACISDTLKCSIDHASIIGNFMIKKKLVKYNGGDFVVIHGGFWDRDVLRRIATAAGV